MIDVTMHITAHHHALNGAPIYSFRLSTHGIGDNVRIEPIVEYPTHNEAVTAAHRMVRALGLTLFDEAKNPRTVFGPNSASAHLQPKRWVKDVTDAAKGGAR